MFYSRMPVFLNDSNPAAGSTSTTASSGAAPTAPVVSRTAADYFNQAAEELSEDLPDEEGEPDVGLDDGGGTQPEQPNVPVKETPGEATDLPLYVFDGKVMGKDVSIKIESKKDLDKYISQGAAAKHIIPEFKRLREENSVLRTKAERADVFDNLVTSKPKEFLDSVSDSIDEDTLADWVFDKYHDFKKLAAMNEGERNNERRARLSDKLLRERDAQQKEAEDIKKRNHVAAVDIEVKRLKSWRDDSKNKYSTKIDAQWHPWLDQQIKNVIMNYKGQLKDGESANLTRMSRLLDDTIAPLLSAIPKKNVDSAVRKTLDDKSNAATREMQSLARKQSGSSSTPTKPMSSDDVWNSISNAVGNGNLKLDT